VFVIDDHKWLSDVVVSVGRALLRIAITRIAAHSTTADVLRRDWPKRLAMCRNGTECVSTGKRQLACDDDIVCESKSVMLTVGMNGLPKLHLHAGLP
jgi:hypothetical protein